MITGLQFNNAGTAIDATLDARALGLKAWYLPTGGSTRKLEIPVVHNVVVNGTSKIVDKFKQTWSPDAIQIQLQSPSRRGRT